MPLYTADALVLRTYPFGEADAVVVFLTPDRGKKRGVAERAPERPGDGGTERRGAVDDAGPERELGLVVDAEALLHVERQHRQEGHQAHRRGEQARPHRVEVAPPGVQGARF